MMHQRLNARGAYERAKLDAARRGEPLTVKFDYWVARCKFKLGPYWLKRLSKRKQREEEETR
jgi:hypothetical protein